MTDGTKRLADETKQFAGGTKRLAGGKEAFTIARPSGATSAYSPP